MTGILSLDQIREQLDSSTIVHALLYTLLDKKSQVIMSNRSDQTVMTPFIRSQGTLNHLDAGISQWVPSWRPIPQSRIAGRIGSISRKRLGDLAEWTLILEQPVAPFQKTLYKNYSGKLTLLFLILLGALALAEFLSRQSWARSMFWLH